MSGLELRNQALAREAAAEGFVLLKNENQALPLKNKRIALYGMGARKTVKGGLGSGSVEERRSVNIEEGLENAGYEIATKRWLDDYDREYEITYQEYHDMVEEKVAGLTDAWKIIPLAHSFVYRFPSGRIISDQDIRESDTDTAIYVLMRQAGEGNDRRLEEGDFYITEQERENLQILTKCYAHTILIVNIGGVLDFRFLDEIEGIDAVVFFAQGGMEGGNALADVLSGKRNFCGKLADTLPVAYEEIPFGEEFSYLNGNLENEYYKEGIYVGYRYFDSFGKAVRYPFGYGLSYTDFEWNVTDVFAVGTNVCVKTEVKNTGELYPGKEVLQLYVSAPEGELHKEYQNLAAFAKTKELRPGEAAEVLLEFDMKDLASYDEVRASWILEKGDYLVRVGNSSRNTEIAAVLHLTETVQTLQCRNCCTPEEAIEELQAPLRGGERIPDKAVHVTIPAERIRTEKIIYDAVHVTETKQEKTLLDSLTDSEMAALLQGGNMQGQVEGMHNIPGMAGTTATGLREKGIGNIALCDGPAGINVTNRVCYCADGSVRPTEIPERYRWGALAKMPGMTSEEGTIVYRYATAWPVGILLAQTWDTELLHRIGTAVAEEMRLFGVTLWLAPGMNIHRNPLGGRTFEYYSEDPLLSGKMAAALTNGVQQEHDLGVTIKHFCSNNNEDNRDFISSNLSERALREIYLKGFRIAVTESQPKAVMSSYNKVNHVYTANRKDLLTDVLRSEWGFEGIVMSDWNACGEDHADPGICAEAGNDLVMPGTAYDRQRISEAMESGTLSKEVVRASACRILRLLIESGIGVI